MADLCSQARLTCARWASGSGGGGGGERARGERGRARPTVQSRGGGDCDGGDGLARGSRARLGLAARAAGQKYNGHAAVLAFCAWPRPTCASSVRCRRVSAPDLPRAARAIVTEDPLGASGVCFYLFIQVSWWSQPARPFFLVQVSWWSHPCNCNCILGHSAPTLDTRTRKRRTPGPNSSPLAQPRPLHPKHLHRT